MKREVILLSTVLLAAALFAFFSGAVSASQVQVENYSISSEYPAGSNITGTITLGLNSVPYNSELIANRGTSSEQIIPLSEFINKQANFSKTIKYSCSPSSCNSSYSAVTGSESSSKQFSLAANQQKILGMLITGKKVSPNTIKDFSFNVTSDAPAATSSQLTVTPLNDSSIAWSANKPSGEFGGAYHEGCYNSSASLQAGSIGTLPYCEQIILPPAPLVELGATLSGSGSSGLKMHLEDSNRNQLGSCTIPAGKYSGTDKICIVKNKAGDNTTVNGGTYFACVNSSSDNSGYSITYEQQDPICGFQGISSPYFTADYPIFAILGTFAPVGSVVINDSTIPNIESSVDTYLKNNYNYSCPAPEGCTIPIVIKGAQSQNIKISNAAVTATIAYTATQNFNGLYGIDLSSATLSTNGNQNFSLAAAGFSVGTASGNQNFNLDFYNGTSYVPLFSKTINIIKVPQPASISPTITAAGVSVPFTVSVNNFGANASITKYLWNFGDGQTITTAANTTEHSYNKVGAFNMEVTIVGVQGLSSTANFTITTTTPKGAADALLKQKIDGMKSLQDQINNYSAFIQGSLNDLLNLNNISLQLTTLKDASLANMSDAKYILLIKELSALNVPTIKESVDASSVPFVPNKNDINLDALKSTGGYYDPTEQSKYIDAIDAWEHSNVSITMNYKEFSTVYDNSEGVLMSAVELHVVPESSGYLFIPSFDNIKFNGAFQKAGSYYYTPLSAGNPETLSFSTTQSLDPTKLPIFFSPSLDSISIPGEAAKTNWWVILAFIIIGIVVAGGIAYVILGKWYQKRYESYLFKNKNDLYNIVTYIHSAKVRGIKNNEIEKTLRSSSWTSEQISYVMKKYAGKGVGLPGFIKRMKDVRIRR